MFKWKPVRLGLSSNEQYLSQNYFKKTRKYTTEVFVGFSVASQFQTLFKQKDGKTHKKMKQTQTFNQLKLIMKKETRGIQLLVSKCILKMKRISLPLNSDLYLSLNYWLKVKDRETN